MGKIQKRTRTNTIKKIILLTFLIFTTSFIYAQWSIDEDFEGGAIPADWTIYDGNNDGDTWFTYQNDDYSHSGEWMAGVECMSSNGNDWLITPQVTIQSGDSFIFFTRAWYGSEDMNIKLSTSGNAIGDFDVTLESVTGLGTAYIEYTYDVM